MVKETHPLAFRDRLTRFSLPITYAILFTKFSQLTAYMNDCSHILPLIPRIGLLI